MSVGVTDLSPDERKALVVRCQASRPTLRREMDGQTHTRARAHTHASARAHTHKHTLARTQARAHPHLLTHRHRDKHARTHAGVCRAHMHARTHIRSRVFWVGDMLTNACGRRSWIGRVKDHRLTDEAEVQAFV